MSQKNSNTVLENKLMKKFTGIKKTEILVGSIELYYRSVAVFRIVTFMLFVTLIMLVSIDCYITYIALNHLGLSESNPIALLRLVNHGYIVTWFLDLLILPLWFTFMQKLAGQSLITKYRWVIMSAIILIAIFTAALFNNFYQIGLTISL